MCREEPLAMLSISKGFGSTWARGGERPGAVAARQALCKVRPLHVLVKEARIETVAGADRIYRVDDDRGTDKTFVASLCKSTLAAEFYDHKRYELRELANRDFQVVCPRRFAGFTLVGHKHVDIAEYLVQSALPAVVWIVVCVQ